MNTMISILLTILNNPLTDNTAREITRQILISYSDLANLKAGDLAERSFCNTSTINRYCKNLGFKSFNELKTHMVTHHDVRSAQLLHHMKVADENKMLDNITALAGVKFSRETFVRECEKLNQMIYEAPRVIITGAVFPEAMTFHYEEDMLELGKCIYNTPVLKSLELPAEDENTLVILISFTGRMVAYCRNEYNELCRKFKKSVIMTGHNELTSVSENHIVFRLPIVGDDEASNTVFIEIMRYLKYKYYITYCQNG